MKERKEKLFFIGVKALIQDDNGKVLVLLADVSSHRMNTEPYWDIPGGRIETGDSEMETLKKELQEETTIEMEANGELIATVFSNHEIPLYEGGFAGLLLRIWRVPYVQGMNIELSSEHTKYEWVTPKDAADRLRHKYPAEFCTFVSQM
ncbi:MAG: NUDIX hydrolase [Candidatus Saccharimonadales bacterium]